MNKLRQVAEILTHSAKIEGVPPSIGPRGALMGANRSLLAIQPTRPPIQALAHRMQAAAMRAVSEDVYRQDAMRFAAELRDLAREQDQEARGPCVVMPMLRAWRVV